MEISKINDLVNRLDSLRKFAKCMNDIMKSGENNMILQVQKSFTREEIGRMIANGENVQGVMELVTPDGEHHYEKPIARLDVMAKDIAPLMVDLIEHCCDKSRELSSTVRQEANK